MEAGFIGLFPNPNKKFRCTVVQNKMSSFHRRLLRVQELEGTRLSVCTCGENQYWDRYLLKSCLQVRGIMVLIFSWHLFASVGKGSEDDNLANAHLCKRERVKNYYFQKNLFFFHQHKKRRATVMLIQFQTITMNIWPQTQSLEGRYNLINSAFWSDSVPEAKLHFEVGSCHDLTVDFQNLQTVNYDGDEDQQVHRMALSKKNVFSQMF